MLLMAFFVDIRKEISFSLFLLTAATTFDPWKTAKHEENPEKNVPPNNADTNYRYSTVSDYKVQLIITEFY